MKIRIKVGDLVQPRHGVSWTDLGARQSDPIKRAVLGRFWWLGWRVKVWNEWGCDPSEIWVREEVVERAYSDAEERLLSEIEK